MLLDRLVKRADSVAGVELDSLMRKGPEIMCCPSWTMPATLRTAHLISRGVSSVADCCLSPAD